MTTIEYDIKDGIGFITLDRPEKRNALNPEMVTELKLAFDVMENDENIKVVILNAKGPVFCSGADLADLQKLQNYTYEENLADSTNLKELLLKIYTLKKVVIAQVHGHALAGGCGLASVCDFIFCAPEAKFGYTEVRIGFVPAIVMVFLLRKLGEAKVKQLLLSGELISAEEAQHAGLVKTIFPKTNLATEVLAFATKLASSNSAQAMMTTKQLIADVQSMPLEIALDLAAQTNAVARASDDCKKGISAFLNKQEITW